MGYHAVLSPSSASRWTTCTASINAQRGLPDKTTEASRIGTCCHQIGEEVLKGAVLVSYLHRVMYFTAREEWWDVDTRPHEFKVRVDQEMLDAVAVYVNYVETQVALTGAILEVEQRVPIGQFTGEEGGGGTSDAVLIIL